MLCLAMYALCNGRVAEGEGRMKGIEGKEREKTYRGLDGRKGEIKSWNGGLHTGR